MKIDLLLEELSGSEPFKGLENFLVANEEDDQVEKIFKEFVDRSHNCDNILQLLSTRKGTQAELSLAFKFLGYILISIANDRTSYQSVGIHVTRWILQNQVPQLMSLLNVSNSTKSITSALHCITGMVVIGNAAANEVITHLNFSRINFKLLADKNEFVDNYSVRTWLFNLILAFLNTRDTRCIRQFLQVNGSVSSLFANLENDPADKVIKLLNLLHEVVVMDMNISKTLKVKTFNSSSCGNLMKLYGIKKSDESYDKKSVIESVHRLLITLCTDHKHGIIFKEKSNSLNGSFKSSNVHVLLILKAGRDIWGTMEGKELVAKTLYRCPDITKLFMESFKNLKIEANDNFFSLIKLFAEVTKNIEPWNQIRDLHSKTKGSLKNTLLFIPFVTNKLLIELVGSNSELLIHCGFILIYSIYTKVEETLSKIKEMNELTNHERDDYSRAVLKIVEHIGGGCSKICSSWNKLFSGDDGKGEKLYPSYTKDHPTRFKLLALIVSVFHQHGNLFGYNIIKQRINPINMFDSVIKIKTDIIDKDNGNYQTLLLHILNFLQFAQNSNDFELYGYQRDINVQNDLIILNKQWFISLLNVYNITVHEGKKDKCIEIQELCLKLLNDSLDHWGLSTHCPTDIHIWLNKLSEFNKPNINGFLVDVIVNTVINLFAYIEILLSLRVELEKSDYDKGLDLLAVVNSSGAPLATDNEDVQYELNIPFSCLVLGATEILKQTSDKEILDYFTFVMGDYVSILHYPKILAKYLVGNKVISLQAEIYFNALLGNSSVNVEMKDGDNLQNKLKSIFMSKKYPKGSDFFYSLKEMVISEGDLLSLSSQLLLYLQMLNNTNLDNKKKIKFYWKVLRYLLSNIATNNNSSLYRYLLGHKFIIDNYNPLLSSDFVNMEIRNILMTVMASYPELHCLIRPFIKKLLYNLQNFPKECADTTDFISYVDSFTSNYKVLNSEDLESMITSCFCLEHSDEAMKLLSHLLQLLLKHSDYFVVNFSNHYLNFLFTKLLNQNSFSSNQDDIFTDLIAQILSKTMDAQFAASLMQDKLKELVNGNTFFHELCCQIINLHPEHATTITKQLKKKAVDLTTQIPYILAHFKLDSNNKYLLSYLGRVKESLLQWSIDADSEANDLYEVIIFHMLQKNMFDISELQNISNHWYTQVIQLKSNPPSHILNLSPIYDFLSFEEKKLHDKNDLSANLKFLSINIHLVSKIYGKDKDFSFSKVASNILKLTSELESPCIKSEIEDLSKIWGNFIKKILKHGISDLQHGPQLLTCLSSLIKIVYVEPKHDLMLPLSTILQMLLSHSEFISTLLSQAKDNSAVKEKVVTLIHTIVEIDSNGCEENHIPLLLGGYNASMSSCDQAILKLLFWYEQNGFMPTFLPTIWGKSAISHFAIEKGPGRAHEYRRPNLNEVFRLLDNEKVIETAIKFDMHLNLEPEVNSMCDPDLYDQRFLLMIFLQVTYEKPSMNVMDMMSKGIVAIGIAALSSHCEEVWGAGAAILKNVVILLEQSGYQNLKLQWMWLVAVLGYGLQTKRTRVPSVIVHFLIKATQLLTNPDDIMYKVILNYVFLKPAFSVYKVPELYILYFSDDIEHHKEHRLFFLNLLSSGIRDGLDVQLCHKEAIPKYILGLLTSPTATYQIKNLALRVLKSLVSIPEGVLLLVHDYGLLTQLPLALQPTTLCSKESLQKLLISATGVLAALLDTWNNKMKFSSQKSSLIIQETHKRKRSLSNNNNDSDIPSKKLKTSLASLPSISEGLNLNKYKNTENWLLLEYAICLKNMASYISLYGSPESKLCYENLCKEFSLIDR